MLFDSYDALIDGIDEIIVAQKDLGTQARGRRLARSYWEIGDAIHAHLLANDGKSTYGERFFTRLSNDLNLDQSLVYNMLRFRRGMPNLETIPKLSWSHYIQVISLKSRQQREFYERAAAESSWTVRELKEQIKADLFADARQLGSVAFRPGGEQQRVRLDPRKGELYTYRLMPSLPGQAQDLVVDLGFDNHWLGPIRGIATPRAGMIVSAAKSGGGGHPRYRFSVNRRRGRKLYTVKAVCERVIDGDTILARIDQGFGIWHAARLRLRGIDTPELYSDAGRRAREFVQETMDLCDFVVICTDSRDKYGRYLTDLFYLPGATHPADLLRDGLFLNHELIDRGLARPYAP